MCDSRASFLARNLVSHCLGREPKARVTTQLHSDWLQMTRFLVVDAHKLHDITIAQSIV
jgi:hypothetical protein